MVLFFLPRARFSSLFRTAVSFDGRRPREPTADLVPSQVSGRASLANLAGGDDDSHTVEATTSTALLGEPPVLAVVVNMTLAVDHDLSCGGGGGGGGGNGNSPATTIAPVDPVPPVLIVDPTPPLTLVDDNTRGGNGNGNGNGASNGGGGSNGGDASNGNGNGYLRVPDRRRSASRRLLAADASAASPSPSFGSVSLVTYLFSSATNVTFGEVVLSVPAAGVKFDLEARDWPWCGDAHTLRVSVDVAESSPDKDKLPFAIGDVGRTKQRRVEMVNGAFDLPTVALVDGASFEDVGVDARTLGASGKRALEFDFPHFDESVVYDPTLTVYTAEETEAVLQAIEQQGGGGEGGGGGGNVTGPNATVVNGTNSTDGGDGDGEESGARRSAFAAGLATVAVGFAAAVSLL